MIEKLFEYRGWNTVTDSIDVFYDVKLSQAVGIFPEGTIFAAAIVDREDGRLTLQEEGHVGDCAGECVYELSYQVGEQVQDEQQY
jgi:hypothetical protein